MLGLVLESSAGAYHLIADNYTTLCAFNHLRFRSSIQCSSTKNFAGGIKNIFLSFIYKKKIPAPNSDILYLMSLVKGNNYRAKQIISAVLGWQKLQPGAHFYSVKLQLMKLSHQETDLGHSLWAFYKHFTKAWNFQSEVHHLEDEAWLKNCKDMLGLSWAKLSSAWTSYPPSSSYLIYFATEYFTSMCLQILQS